MLGTEAQTGNEALTARPKATDWAVLVAGLRWAAEVDRRGNEDGNVPEGTTAPRIALKALIAFLNKQPCVERHGAHVSLVRLAGALADLGDGIVSPLFRPTVRNPGNPGKGNNAALIMGFAARTLTELKDGGMPLDDAARRVATALRAGQVRGSGKYDAATVKTWRARIKSRSKSIPPAAIFHYEEPLPPTLGHTPKQRGEALLKVLRDRGRLASL